eukprot:m.40406 g.40406  ORF g.40406 m.40406 type:complete len:459 (+) comp9662_c0_seq2:118-1494(+)
MSDLLPLQANGGDTVLSLFAQSLLPEQYTNLIQSLAFVSLSSNKEFLGSWETAKIIRGLYQELNRQGSSTSSPAARYVEGCRLEAQLNIAQELQENPNATPEQIDELIEKHVTIFSQKVSALNELKSKKKKQSRSNRRPKFGVTKTRVTKPRYVEAVCPPTKTSAGGERQLSPKPSNASTENNKTSIKDLLNKLGAANIINEEVSKSKVVKKNAARDELPSASNTADRKKKPKTATDNNQSSESSSKPQRRRSLPSVSNAQRRKSSQEIVKRDSLEVLQQTTGGLQDSPGRKGRIKSYKSRELSEEPSEDLEPQNGRLLVVPPQEVYDSDEFLGEHKEKYEGIRLQALSDSVVNLDPGSIQTSAGQTSRDSGLKIPAAFAIEFISRSKLPEDKCRNLMLLVQSYFGSRGEVVDDEEFYMLLKLVALAQAGMEPTLENLNKDCPPPNLRSGIRRTESEV